MQKIKHLFCLDTPCHDRQFSRETKVFSIFYANPNFFLIPISFFSLSVLSGIFQICASEKRSGHYKNCFLGEALFMSNRHPLFGEVFLLISDSIALIYAGYLCSQCFGFWSRLIFVIIRCIKEGMYISQRINFFRQKKCLSRYVLVSCSLSKKRITTS